MWGIIPAAGNGTRIQPLAFSKELLPVGSRQHDGTERPRAVSEYLIERMVQGGAESNWIWGAFGMPGAVLHELYRLWRRRRERDEYIGTLINAYLATGGEAVAVPAGTDYVDVGTLGGYREAMRLLAEAAPPTSASRIAPFPVAPRPVVAMRR